MADQNTQTFTDASFDTVRQGIVIADTNPNLVGPGVLQIQEHLLVAGVAAAENG